MTLHLESVGPERLAQDAALWDLYAQAFPLSEREPPEVIQRSLHLGVGRVLAGAAAPGGPTCALAVLHLLRAPDVVFLVYLALGRELRGQGEGRALLEAAWEEGRRGLGEPEGLLWEVDPPETAPDAAERAVRERRLRFFARAGGVLLPDAYLQPPVGTDPAPLPMRLMYRAAPGAPQRPDVPRLIAAMYAQKYGAVNGLPAALLQSLRAAPSR